MLCYILCSRIPRNTWRIVMDESTPAQNQPKWLESPLMMTVAQLHCKDLVLENEYLRVENRILRSKVPKRIPFTEDDRRSLVDSALALGRKLMESVVHIVKPETILAWQRRLEKQKWDYSNKEKRSPGRPRTARNVEALVCQMARDNTWGYDRIQGELKKLDIKVSNTTVANILRRNGLPASPDRKGLTWREFLSRHADVFLCADFLTQEVWTLKGLQTAFIFFVIHLQTRKVLLARATFSPNAPWLKQQARHVLWECEEQGIKPRFFLRDNDGCYPQDFDAFLKSAGIETVKTPFRASNANPVAERWCLSLRVEALNHLILFGVNHLQHVPDEYRPFFNKHRPHQGISNTIPEQFKTETTDKPAKTNDPQRPAGEVEGQEFLGGLLKSYSRKAA